MTNAPETVTLGLRIENRYEKYEDETTEKTVTIPVPPGDSDHPDYEDWEQDHIFAHTGSASGTKTSGDSWYDVEVVASSRPDLIQVGTTYEFGY